MQASALGAAYLAGLAVGIWSDLDELRAAWRSGGVFEPRWNLARREEHFSAWRKAIGSAAADRGTWLGLGFALTAGAAFEATGALAGPFLIDRGLRADSIGWFYGLPVIAATLGGSLLGGRLSDRWGRLRSVAWFLAARKLLVAHRGRTDVLTEPVVELPRKRPAMPPKPTPARAPIGAKNANAKR